MISLLIGLLATLAGSLLFQNVTWLKNLDLRLYDALTKEQSTLDPDPRIVIIGIDDDTFVNLDLTERAELRQYHPDLIQGLKNADAALLYSDLFFRTTWKPDVDAALQKAVSEAHPMPILIPLSVGPYATAPELVTGYRIEFQDTILKVDPKKGVYLMHMKPIIIENESRGIYSVIPDYRVDPPIPLPHGSVAAASLLQGVAIESIRLDVDAQLLKLGASTYHTGPDGEIEVRFLRPSTDFEFIEYSEALEKLKTDEGRSMLKGKVALLGDIRDSSGDVALTPVGRMPGVNYAAHSLNTLLQTAIAGIRRLPDSTGLLFAFAITSLLPLFGLPLNGWRSTGSALLLAAAGVLIPFTLFASSKLWMPAIPALTAFAISLLLTLGVESVRVRQIAERFLPKFFVEGRQEDASEEAVIIFVDIRGSTEMVAEVGFEEGRRILSGVLERIIPIIEKNQGEVERSLGDGLMGIFRARQTSRYRQGALDSVIQMQDAIKDLAEDVRAKHGRLLALSFGLEEGRIAGRILETSSHQEWSSFGIDIHMAARLQAEAGKQDVACVVGPRLRQACESEFEFEPIKPFRPKGFSEDITPYSMTNREHLAGDRLSG